MQDGNTGLEACGWGWQRQKCWSSEGEGGCASIILLFMKTNLLQPSSFCLIRQSSAHFFQVIIACVTAVSPDS